MMPLCTTHHLAGEATWGWALRSLGSPWVAQRVCPMPIVPSMGDSTSLFGQVAELSNVAADGDAAALNDGDARRIIAAIFQPAQPVQDNLGRVALADIGGRMFTQAASPSSTSVRAMRSALPHPGRWSGRSEKGFGSQELAVFGPVTGGVQMHFVAMDSSFMFCGQRPAGRCHFFIPLILMHSFQTPCGKAGAYST